MSEFKIKTQNARSAAQDLNNIARQMKGLEDQIRRIQNGLSFEIAQKERIRQRLRTAQNNTASHSKKLYSSTSTLQNVVNAYETTEQRLAGKQVAKAEIVKTTEMSAINGVIFIGTGEINPSAVGMSAPSIVPFAVGELASKLIDKYGKTSETLDSIEQDSVSLYSKNNNKQELKESDIQTTKFWEKSWDKANSAWHMGDSVDNEDSTHASYNIDLLKYKASAEIYGGTYCIDSETGKKKLRLAAGASLGFTMSAFSADAEMQLGNSNFGGYLKGDVTAGKVDAKAEGVIGLRDAEGNINPTLHGRLSAEAIAAEASIKGGVKVAGTDIGVKASARVGIGAHAEAGYKDGKLSLDVGASFGVGGSVKLEVDVSGTIKAVSGAVKSAWNTVAGWFT